MATAGAAAGDAPAFFGHDFGQKIDLTVRIREILRNYPEGTSIFKEMVQNADDAGATEVRFCLDYRQHAAQRLAYQKLAPFQGPSLLVFNNATFTDADFESIQRIGDSLKKDNSNGWKTGRFGVGFNSVYHVTDLPAFVSGSQLVFFDPQACHLPNVNPSNPGKMIDFIAHPDLVANYPDQLTPFRCFGCDFAKPFEGTLFRLALRNEEQAAKSRLTSRVQTPEHVGAMLDEFADGLHLVLLFLRNIAKITILEWRDGTDAPSVRREVEISNMTATIKSKRMLKSMFGTSGSGFTEAGIASDYSLNVTARNFVDSRFERTYTFAIYNQLGGGSCTRIANDPGNAIQRLVPWGGVAVPTSVSGEFPRTTGMAFCFLPLPTQTYLPIHVNGYFELSSNRRDIWFGDGLSGDGLLRAQWNLALLRDVIGPCYARALLDLTKNGMISPQDHTKLFPDTAPPAPWNELMLAVLRRVRATKCLRSDINGGEWVSPSECCILRRDVPSYTNMLQWLTDEGLTIVKNLSPDLERLLVETQTIPGYLEPVALRRALLTRKSVHSGNREAIKALVNFMLSDLRMDTLGDLDRVNFLPTADGALATFYRQLPVDPALLEQLCSMGFSRHHGRKALIAVGGKNVERALNWILQNPDPIRETNPEGQLFLIPSAEQLRLLDKAQARLVDSAALDERNLKLLGSETVHDALNIKKMGIVEFEETLSLVFPPEWHRKAFVDWHGDVDKDVGGFTELWFRDLWSYIGRSDQLSAFCDKWPLVPTSTGVLVSLSTSCGVLCPELIPRGVLACLEKLHVRLLLPNLFASFQPNPEVWQYIQQPTAEGVANALKVVLNAQSVDQKFVSKMFETTTQDDREQLRAFLVSGASGDLKSNQLELIRRLPLFCGFTKPVSENTSHWISDSEDSIDPGAANLAGYSREFVSTLKADGTQRSMCMGLGWQLLDENFIFVKENDTDTWRFLARLGVEGVSSVEFVAHHLIPRLHELPSEARADAVCYLLQHLASLLAEDFDGSLSAMLEAVPIFPSRTGELKRIGDLYDPDMDEFADIMDDSFFPALELQDPQPLAMLRSIGLQRVLSRRSILSLAVSIEQDQAKLVATESETTDMCAQSDIEETHQKLRTRSAKFVQYLDSHLEQLTTPQLIERSRPKAPRKAFTKKGLKFLRTFLGEEEQHSPGSPKPDMAELERRELERREIDDLLAKLAVISWVPVLEDRPSAVLPWQQDLRPRIVVPPMETCPEKHMWLCSSEYYVVKSPVHSNVLRKLLGWGNVIPIEVIASQLRSISVNFAKTVADRDTHAVWSAVFELYKRLSHFFESERSGSALMKRVQNILLDGGDYIWIGNSFVSPIKVAATTLVNAEPYLYTIPSELLHFRPLFKAIGVRERFEVIDYIQALGAMRASRQEDPSLGDSNTSPEKEKKLKPDELTVAIGLIQLISDKVMNHTDYELFAPDTDGTLVLSATLTFDDAPWLDKNEFKTPVGGTLRFVHPKISNEVAAKIGVKSLRSQLLHANVHESISFGTDGDVEAFGQSEALTKRISRILEQYPDGPNILNELIQNADDAGASTVRILYDNCSYGTSSLLSPGMAKWQGPALYCYNDAEFSDSDFINLARIGQGSKLQRATTTGRFGLGFNSVYHFTDLPTIVSANSIVMFDPHATHLPGISTANPGLKIRFVNSHVVRQFPDQFAPLTGVFGCNLHDHFHGTLFRFPLRTSDLADTSEIKRRSYSRREVAALFRRFRDSVTETMLFLRNIQNVEVYAKFHDNEAPVLLFGTNASTEDRSGSWRQIEQFMKGNDPSVSNGLSAKRDFYARLRATPPDELPSITQVVSIETTEQFGLTEFFTEFEDDVDAAKSWCSTTSAQTQIGTTTAKYLVCNHIGGGKAREMACAPENASLKLIPWAGIASRIDDAPTEGRAFCFLPLPVRIGLPVHVNGYFELSSNRRDVWHGDDMTGEGKLRSEWNSSLLVDAVAPAYISFLIAAREACGGDIDKYFSLFPARVPSQPWDKIVVELFRRMKSHPVFISHNNITGIASSPVSPGAAVVIDETLPEWEQLEAALTVARLPTVMLPRLLRDLVVELNAVKGAMTPSLFRDLVQVGTLLPQLGYDAARCVIGFCLREGTSGSTTCSLESLNGLPILPLKDGSYHRFMLYDDNNMHRKCYFGNPQEEELLSMFPDLLLSGDYRQLFDGIPNVYEKSNVGVVNLDIIAQHFFPAIVGANMISSPSGVLKLQEEEPSSQRSKRHDWLCTLWQYVDTVLISGSELPSSLLKLPILPVTLGDNQSGWIRLPSQFGVVVRQSDSSLMTESLLQELVSSLACVGVYVVDPSVVSGDKSLQWLLQQKFAHKLSPSGLLMALECVHMSNDRRGFDDIFSGASDQARLAICSFLSSGDMNSIPNSCEPVLFDLPIFPVYPDSAGSSDRIALPHNFVTLRRGGYLPDTSADPRLLDSSFFRVDSEPTRKFLRDCGVDEWSSTKILMDYVFPRLHEIERHSPSLVDETLVSALGMLPFHQKADPRFRPFIQSQAIFPSRKRAFRRISELHDPNSKELSNLVGENSLPSEAFASQEIVDILRTLGLRMGLSCHAVLESARSVETMIEEGGNSSASGDAWEKASSLLAIVNKHFDSMAASIKQENDESSSDSSLREIINNLRNVRWLPVSTTPSDSLMPWRTTGQERFLASPAESRPRRLAWFCSAKVHILEGELTSQELVTGFGWDQPIEAETLADQLVALAREWDAQHCRHSNNAFADENAMEHTSTHLQRFPLPEVRQMYEMLENHRIANEEAWQASPITQKLSRFKWVWTGKTFASIDQIAVESEANLEPLLFSMPSEHIVPRSLIESFSPKRSFRVADLLQALAHLSKRVVVSHDVANACMKIFSLMQQDDNLRDVTEAVRSLTPEDIVLLDESNRLVPASQLTYEDMEWNESVEVRRGTLFVRKDIPNDVAAAMGATSLHSKLSETSVRSRRVACPSASGLKSVLPSPSSWHPTFFTDALVTAERVGATQLHFFVDYRHHPAQKVLQPSLQPLQSEALCIHLEDVVLSEQEINVLFRGEASRAGLLCGFAGSDCMQILSGNAFYVLDPTGSYLAPPTTSPTRGDTRQLNSSHGVGRQYDLLGPTFRQYSDQLLPFMSLPTNQGNVSQGTRSTLIRFPWRKTQSPISSFVMSKKRARKLVNHLKSQLHHALLFTESVHRISVWTIGEDSEFARHCHGEVALNNPESVLRKRVATRRNDEWKRKNFSFQSFFKSAVTPENQMDFIVNLELENVSHRDTWLFSDNIGAGRSRDLACSPIHEPLQSTPYVSVACHILRDGNPAPRLHGRIFKIADTAQRTGLPVHFNGCFKTSLKETELVITSGRGNASQSGDALSGSEISIKANWNRVLLEDGVVDAYLKLLLVAKRVLASSHPKALYSIWPSLQKVGESGVGSVLQSHIYRQLATQELFLCSDGQFRGLSNGYLLDTSNMDMQVAAFAQLHFPAFDIPKPILDECSSLLPSRVHKLTPQTMRRALKTIDTGGLHANVCLSILEYCLSDISSPLPIESHPVWAEFNGLALLPLEDGSVGVIRVNQRNRFVLASYNQVELLSPLRRMFVSLAARQRLHRYFADPRFLSVMGISAFSIKTLADNVERVLPRRWKNQEAVAWNPGSADEIDRLWLHRFWQEVRFEHRSLGYFAAWPLIPTKGSRLVSCGKPEAAACVWLESGDSELASENSARYTESAAEKETELAELENERQRLRGLANLDDQVQEDDGATSESDSDRSDDEASEVSEEENTEAVVYSDDGHNSDVSPSSNAFDDSVTVGASVDTEEIPASDAILHENEEAPETRQDELVGAVPPEFVTAFGEAIVDVMGDGATNDASSNLTALDVLCPRETLHEMLSAVGIPLVELAYFSGQENEIVARSAEVATSIVDAVFVTVENQNSFSWDALTDEQVVLLVEYLSLHGDTYGGYNRMYLEKLKRLPVYITSRGTRTSLATGNFFIIPAEIDVEAFPLPPDSRQWFLLSNPRLNSFYRDLGVEEMSDAKLLLFVLPLFGELAEAQRDTVLTLILEKWQHLRGNAELVGLLKQAPIFQDSDEGEYHEPSAFFDPRNKVLSAIYSEVSGLPLAMRFQSPEWLNVLGEIGLRTDLTVDMFLECARRIDAECSTKQCLSAADERLVVTLHQYFVQNFEKFDRSRTFFDAVSTIAFVLALAYGDSSARRVGTGNQRVRNFTARLVVCRYSECVAPEEQALAFTTMPVVHGAAVPPRVLWSRLRLASPPPKEKILTHLAVITHQGDRGEDQTSAHTLDWQFFIPAVDVFQAVFKYLQSHWDELNSAEQHQLSDSAIIPVGSDLVKGSRLFFHLAENLAPLMFEVPRAFGAYDTLFRQMGSKESPSAEDYIQLLQDLHSECGRNALNLNELLAVCRVVKLLANAVAEMGIVPSLEDQRRIFLPSSTSVMQPMLRMAHNDAQWLSARIELNELHLVHPRIPAPVCQLLGVPALSTVVSEEMVLCFEQESGARHSSSLPSDLIGHMNSVLASDQFGNGLRRIITVQHQKTTTPNDLSGVGPDFEDLDRRIAELSSFVVEEVGEVQSRFVARVGLPLRTIDVTKVSARTRSAAFVDQERHVIYVSSSTLQAHPSMRVAQVVASSINQLLGGSIQDCTPVESILQCDVTEIMDVLQLLNMSEDPTLIAEKLRGTLGEPLTDADRSNVELAPLRSCLPGEIVAIQVDGALRYAKIVESRSSAKDVTRYNVRVSKSTSRWLLATEIYSFRSGRSASGSGSTEMGEDEPADPVPPIISTNSFSLSERPPASSPPVIDSSGMQSSAISDHPVGAASVMSAVNDLLSRLNVSLSSDFEELVGEVQRLKQQLAMAEESRRIAAAQIDEAIREKRDAEDALVCAICLEARVNRVLVPCGHIYCGDCVDRLPRAQCPLCRSRIASHSAFHVPS